MLNYIRSEFYRLRHSKKFWIWLSVYALGAILVNVIIWYLSRSPTEAEYSTYAPFSLVAGNGGLFLFSAMFIADAIYAGNKENGNIRNSIASGINRLAILAGKCIVAALATLFIMFVTVLILTVLGELILKHAGSISFADVWAGTFYAIPLVVAAVVSMVVMMEIFGGKGILCYGIWIFIWVLLPAWLPALSITLHSDIPLKVAAWCPHSFFSAADSTFASTALPWSTSLGATKFIVAGLAGIAIFGLIGALALRRKEV